MATSFQPDAEFFERIPTQPGVYLMKDRHGAVIYVGKAKHLRNRVRQYFRPGGDEREFVATGLLGLFLADVETVVVDNEKEALLLENHLIKQHQPRFNVKLRDDKQYLVLRIDPAARYPRVEVVRHIREDDARYFGPYHSATSCRETLRTLNRHFQLRTCTDHVLNTRTRPCLQYQIQRCPGPCVYPIPTEQYAEQVDDVMMFLAGKDDELTRRLRGRMLLAAEREDFERAAQLRDSIRAVERTLAKQSIVQEDFVDQDVFGLHREDDAVEVIVLFIRSGKLVGRRSFRERDQEFADADVLSNAVLSYYDQGTVVPDQVIVPVELEDAGALAEWLGEKRGRKVQIVAPQRGPRVKLVALAQKNAQASAAARKGREDDTAAALAKLQERLELRALPRRIECYDIAHIQGTATVASMVVFVDGQPAKSLYKKFKLRGTSNDDFASMYEVLSRRFRRRTGDDPSWALPDLLVVDGGKGQLGSALAAAADAGVEVSGERGLDVISLAKEKDLSAGRAPDRVYLRGAKDAVQLRPNTTELYLLARIRDEAHRFANTFHQQRRKKSTLRSALDDVPGIGAKRRRELLRHFGSLKGIRAATVDELQRAPGMSRAAAAAVASFFAAGRGAAAATAAAISQGGAVVAATVEVVAEGADAPALAVQAAAGALADADDAAVADQAIEAAQGE